jgi:phage replication initiation protein
MHIDYLSLLIDVEKALAVADDCEYDIDTTYQIYNSIDPVRVCLSYEFFLSSELIDGVYLVYALKFLDATLYANKSIRLIDRRRGLFGYQKSLTIFDDHGDNLGMIAYGGNGGGLYISLSGLGMQYINSEAVYKHLVVYDVPVRLTRVDIAHDFFEGEHTVEQAVEAYKNGEFGTGGRKPSAQFIDDLGSNNGKTLYVGRAVNGKMLRVYEKGKQLNNKKSKWVRFEVQFGNKDRVIPLDILSSEEKMTQYFKGAYGYLGALNISVSHETQKIKISKKTVCYKLSHKMKYAKLSYGKLVKFLQTNLKLTSLQIVNALKRDDTYCELILDFEQSGLAI